MFAFFTQYFWLLAIGIGLFNYFRVKSQVRAYIDEKPERESGYEQLATGLLLIMTLPWLIVGAGIISGQIHSVFEVLSFHGGHWVSKLFWTVIGSTWLGLAAWVLLGSGADLLADHPGLLRFNFPGVDPLRPTARQIRLVWLFFVGVGVLVFALVLSHWPPGGAAELPAPSAR